MELFALKVIGGHLAQTAAGQAVTGYLFGHVAGGAASSLATAGLIKVAIHSSTVAIQHASMSFAWGVITSAASGPLLGAGGYALVHGAYTTYSISKQMEKAKGEMEQSWFSQNYEAYMLNTYNHITSNKKHLMPVYSLLNEMYAQMGHRNWSGEVKTRLSSVEACTQSGCGCLDYSASRGTEKTSDPCKCGHSWVNHHLITHPVVNLQTWLLCVAATAIYPALGRSLGFGRVKTDLSEIRGCSRCICSDMKCATGFSATQNCFCGHPDSDHTQPLDDSNVQKVLFWIVIDGISRS